MYTEGGEGVRAVGDESMSYQPTREFKNILELPILPSSVNYSWNIGCS
jgi:hypothetical protein